jgi:hypothetical protein
MTAAIGLATVGYAQTSPGPQPNDQAVPAPQQPMPPDEQGTPPRQVMPGDQATPAPRQTMPPADQAARAAPPAANADVVTRLAAIVPSGMSSEEACSGFRSVEECATALHLAQNLNIPFTDLKSRLASGERVSAIIHDFKPQADPKVEIARARDQAHADVGAAPQG